jgi:hypothetical protein
MSSETTNVTLAGPQSVHVKQISWLGPLAAPGGLMTLRNTRFAIVNAASSPCQIATIALDPVSVGTEGTTADAQLTLQPAGDIATALAPGAALELVLGGAVSARPGAYATTARVMTRDGGAIAIPIALTVPAAPIWGIVSMVLGLVLLGTVNLLAGEGAEKTRLHDALQARQDIHSVLESHPVPESRAGDVAAMDYDFDTAIAALGKRRRLSVVDHRTDEAQAYLADATTLAGTLRSAVAGHPRGAAEIADVTQDWQSMQQILQEIAALPNALPDTQSGLSGKLDNFLLRFRRQMLQQPAGFITVEIKTELGRMALDEAAGEGDAARELALTTRLWLRRSALFLNRVLTSYRSAVVEAGWMLNTDAAMRDRVAHDDMAPEFRSEIVADLDQAAAQMDGDAWLDNWKAAHSLVNRAWTAQVKGVTQMAKQRVAEIIATANRQTNTSDVDALMAQAQAAPKPHTMAMKQAILTQALTLWRAHAARLDEADWRDKLNHQIDALQALINAGKITESIQPYRGLLNSWAALNAHLVQRAIDQLDHPRCLEIFADLQRNTAGIEAVLREQPFDAAMAGWDQQLDQIRLDMHRDGPDAEAVTHDCTQPLLNIEARVNALSGTIFAASLADIPLNALTRIRLAQASGVAEAINATQANKNHPRNLILEPITPAADQVVDRNLIFTLRGQDPVWRSETTIQVDFGDGSKPFQANAEQLRQGRQIEHSYGAALTAHLTVTATEAPVPGSATATLLGAGKTSILVAPSPVTGAQVVADEFLNLRFGLALLIALTVYYWRYQNRTAVFGTRTYDYVEAFALGFAADAAVSNFPAAIRAFAPS